MKHHVQEKIPQYISKAQQVGQAVFYCYDTSSERIPLGIIFDFTFNSNTIVFKQYQWPIIEIQWQSFAAELHFYRKDIPEAVILDGIGEVNLKGDNTVSFTIQNVLYKGNRSVSASFSNAFTTNEYNSSLLFYKKFSELVLQPFKRKITGAFQ